MPIGRGLAPEWKVWQDRANPLTGRGVPCIISAMESFTIQTPKGPRTIGAGHPCFIVAEVSGNHLNGFTPDGFERAKRIIRAAAEAGADAVKLQTYTPDTITFNSRKARFMENNGDNPPAWQGKSMYELYQGAYTPFEWDEPLKKFAEELGLFFFSSPFDTTAVDLLESLGVGAYKIASYECTDHVLLRRVAAAQKPVIMSTGYATREEVDESVKLLRQLGVRDLALLHCITYYSTRPEPRLAYLATMLDQRDRYGVVAGFSDNNDGVEIPAFAVALGASIVEKHIILDEDKAANRGYDAQFSLSATVFAKLVQYIRAVERIINAGAPLTTDAKREALKRQFPYFEVDAAIGRPLYGPRTLQEKGNLRFRRSLFAVRDIQAGEALTSSNVRSIRPSDGLPTKYYGEVIGKRAAIAIEAGTPLWWDMIAP